MQEKIGETPTTPEMTIEQIAHHFGQETINEEFLAKLETAKNLKVGDLLKIYGSMRADEGDIGKVVELIKDPHCPSIPKPIVELIEGKGKGEKAGPVSLYNWEKTD